VIKSSDNNYIIEVQAAAGGTSVRFSFENNLSNNSTNKYTIKITNNINIPIKDISCTESDLLVLIDNIDMIENNFINETYIYFTCNNTDMISTVFKIENDYNNRFELESKITIYDYIDETLNKIVSINMTNNLSNLIEEIYKIIQSDG
jgi:hypothetical protein